MRCWGENREGQLGNGTTANPGTAQPVTVSGISGATAFTTGAYHTCAVLGNGTLRCWGRNGQGQLGNGTYTNSSTPVAGERPHRCRRRQRRRRPHVRGADERHGAVLGRKRVRPARQRDDVTSSTPVQVAALVGAVDVSAGWRHTCALLGNGAVRCWGQGQFGQLGNGTTTNSTTPVPVSGITGAVGVTAGWWHHSCALLGAARCGAGAQNDWGQFGNGTTTRLLHSGHDDRPRRRMGEQQHGGRHHQCSRTGNGRQSRNHDDHGDR